jgi:hypothetical protein
MAKIDESRLLIGLLPQVVILVHYLVNIACLFNHNV